MTTQARSAQIRAAEGSNLPAGGSPPPTLLAIVSMLAVQTGAADAKGLFHFVGPLALAILRRQGACYARLRPAQY
jgi:threonine/homoserine efflux transporter RhtA